MQKREFISEIRKINKSIVNKKQERYPRDKINMRHFSTLRKE